MFIINALLSSCSAHLRLVADPGEGTGMGLSYFYIKLTPEGPKKFGGDQAPPVMLPSCLRVWVTGLPHPLYPFISRSGSSTEDGLLFRIIHIKVGVLVRDSE